MGTSISSIAEHAFEALRAAGYMESTVRQYRKVFRCLEKMAPDGMWTEDVGREFTSVTKPDGTPFEHNYQLLREKVAYLCECFVFDGTFDLRKRRRSYVRQGLMSDSMSSVLSDYERSNEERGLSEGTRECYHRTAEAFLMLLERSGVNGVEGAAAESVTAFVSFASDHWPGTSSYHVAGNLRPFLRYLGREDLVAALALTRPHRDHRIIEPLGSDEADAVAESCCDGTVGPMEAAVTLLALTTGMRACDIIALRIADLDFRASSISFVQRKTGNPVTVPMCPALAEALGRYLLESRPDSDSPTVFVRQKAPHTPLADHSAVYEATRRTLSAAGVRGGGSLLLRHSAASRMVAAGVRLPIVSAVLGHSEPDSTNVYIATDDEGMRSCVLPLPRGAVS
ncbi:MAG: tyrosine-type recombinase/integrase [Atopobiaceae bacterium]|nr:tyrosine-type recombinase/integrase [Atopobiaceae bacterium]